MRTPLLISILLMSATVSFATSAEQLIKTLKMEKIPVEGAWFALTYTSADKIDAAALPPRYGAPRLAGTAIYALVTPADFSAMHKLRTDEIWHFYVGDPIELLLLHPDGRSEVVIVGPDLLSGQRPQFTVHAGVWMGARPKSTRPDAYSLFGCTLAPGFDYADFETGYRDELQKAYPQHAAMIGELTREECATRPENTETSPVKMSVEPGPLAFNQDMMAAISIAPGIELRELIGRTGQGQSTRASIAQFKLGPGKTTGRSYNKIGEEYFVVISGKGTVKLENETIAVRAGSVVLMKPGSQHSITADADSSVEFYAITTPAFSLEDYVRVSDAP